MDAEEFFKSIFDQDFLSEFDGLLEMVNNKKKFRVFKRTLKDGLRRHLSYFTSGRKHCIFASEDNAKLIKQSYDGHHVISSVWFPENQILIADPENIEFYLSKKIGFKHENDVATVYFKIGIKYKNKDDVCKGVFGG